MLDVGIRKAQNEGLWGPGGSGGRAPGHQRNTILDVSGPEKLKLNVFGVRRCSGSRAPGHQRSTILDVPGPQKLKMKVLGIGSGPEAEPRVIKGVPCWTFRDPKNSK